MAHSRLSMVASSTRYSSQKNMMLLMDRKHEDCASRYKTSVSRSLQLKSKNWNSTQRLSTELLDNYQKLNRNNF
jgi:hypothetical protein